MNEEIFNKCNEILETLYKNEKFEESYNEFLKIANETHFPLAEMMTGYFLMNGIGTEMNMDKAFEYLQQAAYHGDSDAQYYVGYMYENGLSQGRDIVEAMKWFKIAAKNGSKEAIDKCALYNQEFDEEDMNDPARYMYD